MILIFKQALDALGRLDSSVSDSRVCQMVNECFDEAPANIITPLGNPELEKRESTPIEGARNTFTVLQITDLHINLQYREVSFLYL